MHSFNEKAASSARRVQLLAGITVLMLAACVLLFWNCGGVGSRQTPAPGGGNESSATVSHVFVIVLENKAYGEVIGSSTMPYLNSLAQMNASAANFFANAHPSIGNYFMLTVGKTITSDDGYNGTVSDNNIVRMLSAAGKTWRVYAESLPQAGYMGPDVFPYVKHHVPMAYLSDVLNSSEQRQNIVPFTQLAPDLASGNAPNFALIIPNNYGNGHSCTPEKPDCTVADMTATIDQWLRMNIPAILNSSAMQSGLLVITLDESESSDAQNGGGHIAFVMAGTGVKKGFVSATLYQHQSVLRMSLAKLGLNGYPGSAASAPDMNDFFQ